VAVGGDEYQVLEMTGRGDAPFSFTAGRPRAAVQLALAGGGSHPRLRLTCGD
jgi:hypothetical protein